jgi:hypothetical protein
LQGFPIVLVVVLRRLGMEAVCQNGRGFEWRRQSARDSLVPKKTAEDDDDEENWEMTLNRD